MQAARLTADLQRSREHLVLTREEERRRLSDDLHDGLGPTLASLILQIDAARNRLKHDPIQVDPLLSDVKTQLCEALADIRHLVYELRPPALDHLGLCAALAKKRMNCNAPAAFRSMWKRRNICHRSPLPQKWRSIASA